QQPARLLRIAHPDQSAQSPRTGRRADLRAHRRCHHPGRIAAGDVDGTAAGVLDRAGDGPAPIPDLPATMMGFLSSERARAAVRWIILVVAVCAVIGAMLGLAIARTPVERTVAVIVVPHPDDEFQAWSLIEERAAEYTVFVSLTRGE